MADTAALVLASDDEVPTEAELRIAQAQLVGWLEGLFHGIQASLISQQMAATAQLDRMRAVYDEIGLVCPVLLVPVLGLDTS